MKYLKSLKTGNQELQLDENYPIEEYTQQLMLFNQGQEEGFIIG